MLPCFVIYFARTILNDIIRAYLSPAYLQKKKLYIKPVQAAITGVGYTCNGGDTQNNHLRPYKHTIRLYGPSGHPYFFIYFFFIKPEQYM